MAAEAGKVKELLSELANLKTNIKDVIDKGEPKEYGLDAPAGTVTLTVEADAGDGKGRKTGTIRYQLGKPDKKGHKLFARVDDWPSSIPSAIRCCRWWNGRRCPIAASASSISHPGTSLAWKCSAATRKSTR